MPKRKPIKKPGVEKKPQENFELDLDALTDQLANKPYSENVDPDKPEPTQKTSVDIPETLMNKILIDVMTNKIKKQGLTTNSAIINEAIRFYYENKEEGK